MKAELQFNKIPPLAHEKGWAFPRCAAFEGDSSSIPPEDNYPDFPVSTPSHVKVVLAVMIAANSTFILSCAIKCIISGLVKRFNMRIGCKFSRSISL